LKKFIFSYLLFFLLHQENTSVFNPSNEVGEKREFSIDIFLVAKKR